MHEPSVYRAGLVFTIWILNLLRLVALRSTRIYDGTASFNRVLPGALVYRVKKQDLPTYWVKS